MDKFYQALDWINDNTEMSEFERGAFLALSLVAAGITTGHFVTLLLGGSMVATSSLMPALAAVLILVKSLKRG